MDSNYLRSTTVTVLPRAGVTSCLIVRLSRPIVSNYDLVLTTYYLAVVRLFRRSGVGAAVGSDATLCHHYH